MNRSPGRGARQQHGLAATLLLGALACSPPNLPQGSTLDAGPDAGAAPDAGPPGPCTPRWSVLVSSDAGVARAFVEGSQDGGGGADGGAAHGLILSATGALGTPCNRFALTSQCPVPFLVQNDARLTGDFDLTLTLDSWDAGGAPGDGGVLSQGRFLLYEDPPSEAVAYLGFRQDTQDEFVDFVHVADGGWSLDYSQTALSSRTARVYRGGDALSIQFNNGLVLSTQTTPGFSAGPLHLAFAAGSAIVDGGSPGADWPRTTTLRAVRLDIDGGGVLSDDFSCDTLH